MRHCACGFSGVEIHFLRLDGGKGLSSDCRACQQNRLGIDTLTRMVGEAVPPARPRTYLCFWCIAGGATVVVQTKVGAAHVHPRCLPDVKQFLDGYVAA
jgi:hypothetical protein